jgi:type I restriction enzyme S subunit
MSDDLDFDMEVVGEEELDEMGDDGASSSEERSRPEIGEDTTDRDGKSTTYVEDGPSLGERENVSSDPSSDRNTTAEWGSLGAPPEEWGTEYLAENFEVIKDSVDPSEYSEGDEIVLYSMPAYDEGEGPVRVEAGSVGSKKFRVPSHALLFPKLNITKKRFWLVKETHKKPALCSTEYWPLVPKGDSNLEYYHQLFGADAFINKPRLSTSATTNSHQRIKSNLFEKVRLPVPPLPEQRKIASVLYVVDQAIQKTEAIIEQAKRVKRGLMQDLFSGGYFEHEATRQVRVGPLQNKIPEGWGVKPLDDVTKQVTEIDHKMPEKQEEGVPFLAAGDIVNSYKIDLGGVERISEKDYDRLSEKFDPERGDVLYTRFGTIGHARRVDFEDEFIASYSVALIKPNDRVNSGFLEHFLNSTFARKEAYNRTRGSANRNLNLGEIKKLSVFLPPKSEQTEITRVLDEINELETSHEKKMRQMKRLKKSLMQDLLTGEVRTADKAIDVLDEVVKHG